MSNSSVTRIFCVATIAFSIASVPWRANAWVTSCVSNCTKDSTQVFVTFRYVDPMTGMEVFRMLIPKGWKAEGEVTWSADPALPAQSRFRFSNPAGPEEVNFYTTRAFFWTNNGMFLATNPAGTIRLGTLVARPIGLHDAFVQIIIPGAGRRVSGTTILNEQMVPALAELAKGLPTPGVNALSEAGKMRIAYAEGGRQVEEELYAAVTQFIIQMPASGFSRSYFINYWYVDHVFSFRDQRGKIDSHSKIFQTMIYSLKINRDWAAKVVNVKEMLVQRYIRGIRSVGQIGKIISQAGTQMREDQLRSWEQNQQVKDRTVEDFSDNMIGVERYSDPRAGKEVALPIGYGYAWANNLGEYIVSESADFNPNIGSNLNWEQLERAR